jgi:hypothetical protein
MYTTIRPTKLNASRKTTAKGNTKATAKKTPTSGKKGKADSSDEEEEGAGYEAKGNAKGVEKGKTDSSDEEEEGVDDHAKGNTKALGPKKQQRTHPMRRRRVMGMYQYIVSYLSDLL